MTTQTDTRIATGRVERIANSGRSFYLDSNRMFTQSNNDASPMPPQGAAIRVEYRPWVSGDGQRTVNYYSRWDFDMSASQELEQRVAASETAGLLNRTPTPYGPRNNPAQNTPQSHDGRPQELRDGKPVVTRLACLNAAVRTLAGTGADEETILMLAEKYVAWALYGGTGPKVEKDPPASEVLYNPEYDPNWP